MEALDKIITPEKITSAAIEDPLGGILGQAIEERATDVHFDPVAEGELIRFRIDGIIHEKQVLSHDERKQILHQVKIAANLKFSKSFKPEEGLIIYTDQKGYDHDIRITIIPMQVTSESIHLRFMDQAHQMNNLQELGLRGPQLKTVKKIINLTSGLILITGPTGAGKTTTFYALADAMDNKKRITVSIEDPVEFKNPYMRQLEVDEKHGLNMSEGLKALVRTDPDNIFVGEVRDQHSAVISARAALTGRLVVATVHAPSSAMAIDSLRNLTVPNYVLGGALRLIISQDLVRRLCSNCTKKIPISDEAKNFFRRYQIEPPEKMQIPVGCKKCGGYGFKSRVGVFEVIPVDEEIGEMITADVHQSTLREKFRQLKLETIMDDVLAKVKEGIIPFEEAKRLQLAKRPE